ncbi:MAG TPA: pyridine nucleotide-disulfide oxidoreductase [Dehalococcoidia bacterium]|nr:pyridine nucleotide-disulfide oxidoreductase [Dehalococcoidia bacterium]
MSSNDNWDVVVIGAGPAGLAAAIAAGDSGAKVCIVEREERPGGILKQCIHDGFGLLRFQAKLSGPEYAHRYITMILEREIPVLTSTFTLEVNKGQDGFLLTLQNSVHNIFQLEATALIHAGGCRERTSRQIFLHGDRPAGILTAGTAQYLLNVQGYLPTKRCVILGSGDVGLIMARSLTLEGADVEGVYEIQAEPTGRLRNVVQCLEDFCIPLHLSTTVTRVHGHPRVEGVTVNQVDADSHRLAGTERYVPCDALVLSVGLIPENDILDPLGVPLDPRTGGPYVDQSMMTGVAGIFVCGNALHVNDLVDYVSESGASAGAAAASFALGEAGGRELIDIGVTDDVAYVVPQRFDLHLGREKETILYFRSSRTLRPAELRIYVDDNEILYKKYPVLRPPEMERLVIPPGVIPAETVEMRLELQEVK